MIWYILPIGAVIRVVMVVVVVVGLMVALGLNPLDWVSSLIWDSIRPFTVTRGI